ncbi:hypothetical protein TOPH_04557 [Tolypocladium ophioglossoides CBS 100239]|uniref:Uncharacterized protein n=1 Tax=Tolypocladium ophioglossoides (strain CBS 100239) TaxID=1163406 RepID=A0A0L0NAB6_TOLOC|nr:hypothetical protein TOPH_04557 [Tolypocladium ophioglossoides CBS 100239]
MLQPSPHLHLPGGWYLVRRLVGPSVEARCTSLKGHDEYHPFRQTNKCERCKKRELGHWGITIFTVLPPKQPPLVPSGQPPRFDNLALAATALSTLEQDASTAAPRPVAALKWSDGLPTGDSQATLNIARSRLPP